MNILDRKSTPNLIINLLYLRDYTEYPQNSFGIRLHKDQRAIDVLLTVFADCKIRERNSSFNEKNVSFEGGN